MQVAARCSGAGFRYDFSDAPLRRFWKT